LLKIQLLHLLSGAVPVSALSSGPALGWGWGYLLGSALLFNHCRPHYSGGSIYRCDGSGSTTGADRRRSGGGAQGAQGVRYLLRLRGALLLGLRGALLSRKKISICSEDLFVVRALF